MKNKNPGLNEELKVKAQSKNIKKNPINGTKYTIAISSAKGGVGKSTFATNISLALKKLGCKIGLLDADVQASPNWVESALNLVSTNPNAGAIEGQTLVVNREEITPLTHQTENCQGGRYPTCNMLVRKQFCYFHSGYKIPFREDTDLAF